MNVPGAVPGGDPAAALKKIHQEMQEKFTEAGMNKVEEFVDKMDDLMQTVKDGPSKAMDAVQDKFKELKGTIEKSLEDPSSLAPNGGAIAACGAWYAGAVVSKLGVVKDEVDQFVQSIIELANGVKTPLLKLGEALQKAIGDLEASVKGLAKLPKMLGDTLQGKDSPDDIAKIDVSPMKKALEGGDVEGPMKVILGIKDVLANVIGMLNTGSAPLQEFISNAPDKIKRCFDVPQPLCFLTSLMMGSSPQAMKDLLALCEKLETVSLAPIVQIFNGAKDQVESVNVDAIKTPVSKFLKEAKGLVDKLDKTVSAAKLSSGGGAGSMLSAPMSLFK